MTLLKVDPIFAEEFHNMEPDLCDKYECCEDSRTITQTEDASQRDSKRKEKHQYDP